MLGMSVPFLENNTIGNGKYVLCWWELCNEAKRGFDVSEKQLLRGKKQDFIIHL